MISDAAFVGAAPGGAAHVAIVRAGAALSEATGDPTGLSSPLGRIVIVAGLIAVLVLLILQWRRRR